MSSLLMRSLLTPSVCRPSSTTSAVAAATGRLVVLRPSRLPLPSLSSVLPVLPSRCASSSAALEKASRPAGASLITNRKDYTRITGIPVVPNAREVLLSLYEATIKKAKAYGVAAPCTVHCPPRSSSPTLGRPPHAVSSAAVCTQSNDYNAHVIKLCEYRHSLAEKETDVSAAPIHRALTESLAGHQPAMLMGASRVCVCASVWWDVCAQVAALEAAISCGQVEELIEQAEDEYDLVVAMNEDIRPWEADEEGDAAFTEYAPSFGQTKDDFVLTTSDEEELFKDLDKTLALGPTSDAAAPAEVTHSAPADGTTTASGNSPATKH